MDEVALDVVTGADVRGVSSGDLYAVYVGAVSVAVVMSSKGDRCGLYAGADWGIVGAYSNQVHVAAYLYLERCLLRLQ